MSSRSVSDIQTRAEGESLISDTDRMLIWIGCRFTNID
jgi:hypothetical protein